MSELIDKEQCGSNYEVNELFETTTNYDESSLQNTTGDHTTQT
jgi:hypothetical protein